MHINEIKKSFEWMDCCYLAGDRETRPTLDVYIKNHNDEFYSLSAIIDGVTFEISSKRQSIRRFKTLDAAARALAGSGIKVFTVAM